MGVFNNNNHQQGTNIRRNRVKQVTQEVAKHFTGKHWITSLTQSLKHIAKTIDVSRIYIFYHHQGPNKQPLLTQVYEWTQNNIPKQIRNPLLQSFDYKKSKFAPWILSLKEGNVVQYNADLIPEQQYGMLKVQDIKSLCMVPLYNGNEFWGFLGVDECRTKRTFSAEEIEILQKSTQIFSNTYKKTIFKKLSYCVFPETPIIEKGLIVFHKNNLIDISPKALSILEADKEDLIASLDSNILGGLQVIFANIKKNKTEYSRESLITKKLNLLELDIYYENNTKNHSIHVFIIKRAKKDNSIDNKVIEPTRKTDLLNEIASLSLQAEEDMFFENNTKILQKICSMKQTDTLISLHYKQTENNITPILQYSNLHKNLSITLDDTINNNSLSIIQNFPQNFIHLKVKDLKKTFLYEQYKRHIEKYNTHEFILWKLDLHGDFIITLICNNKNKPYWNNDELNTYLLIKKLLRHSAKNYQKNSALKAAKKSAEISEKLNASFLEKISSELLTPLHIILGYSDILSNGNLKQSERNNYNRFIQASGNQLSGILDKINKITQIIVADENDNNKHIFFKPNTILEEVILQLESYSVLNDTRIEVHYNDETTDPTCYSSPEKIKQILANIIENAIIYSPNEVVYIKVQKLHNNLIFSIKDNGPGISPDISDQLYDIFFKYNHEGFPNSGAGLGLTIAKNYLDQLGGRIWHESDNRKGTTFFITIPCPLDSYSRPLLLDLENDPDIHEKTILVYSPFRLNYYDIENRLGEKTSNLIWTKEEQNLLEIIRMNEDIDLIILSIDETGEDLIHLKNKIYSITSNIPVLTYQQINEILNDNCSFTPEN